MYKLLQKTPKGKRDWKNQQVECRKVSIVIAFLGFPDTFYKFSGCIKIKDFCKIGKNIGVYIHIYMYTWANGKK